MASARLPWWFIFSSLAITSLAISFASSKFPLSISSFISASSSVFTSLKLLTKFNGFCISCAMPAVSSPRLAIFSDCISCACAAVRFFKVCSTFCFSLSSRILALCFWRVKKANPAAINIKNTMISINFFCLSLFSCITAAFSFSVIFFFSSKSIL